MAEFLIQGPDGSRYSVQGNGSEQEAMGALFEQLSAQMSPQERQTYRITKDDAFAAFLMEQVKQPQSGETPEQTDRRLSLGSGQPMQGPSKTLSTIGGMADTLSWGAGDELAAGLDAATSSKTYDQALEQQRELARVLSSENPGSYFSGQIAGAVVPGLLSMGTGTGVGLGGNILRGGATGALQGAGYGFASGEGGLENRSQNAATSAMFAGMFGAGAPIIAKGIGAAWGGLANKLAQRGIDSSRVNTVIDMLEKSGLTPQQAAQKLDELGPEAMLADLTQIEAAGTARVTSDAGNIMASRLANRRMGGHKRVSDDLNGIFGPAQDPFAFREGIRASKQAISPEYELALLRALPMPANTADAMAQGLTFPTKNLSLENRAVMGKVMTEIDDALAADTPSEAAARLLDLRKRFDAMIAYEPRQAAVLSSADKASQAVWKQARKAVDDLLDRYAPGVKQADAKHAPLSAQQSAFDLGRKDLLRGGPETMTPSELNARLVRMTPAERDMVAQGTRSELGRVLTNARQNPGTTLDRITSRDWNGEKLEGLLGPSKANALDDTVARENTFTETSRLIEPGQGSRTAVLQAARDRWQPKQGLLGDLAEDVWAATAGSATTGMPVAGAAGGVFLRRLINRIIPKGGAVDEKLARKVADDLTKTDAERDTMVKGLLGIVNSKASLSAKRQRVEGLLGDALSHSGLLGDLTLKPAASAGAGLLGLRPHPAP